MTQVYEGYIPEEAIDRLFNTIKDNPQTIDFHLDRSDFETNALIIATSSDGCMRSYSVERSGFSGNPSHGCDVRTLLQYRHGDSICCTEIQDAPGYISKIARIDTLKRRYILLNYNIAICQGCHYYIKLDGVEIADCGEIVPAKIFRQASFTDLYWNDSGYDAESEKTRSSVGLHDYQCMDYDESTGELRIPHVVEYYGYYIATEAWHRYQWNGQYFTDKGVEPLFDLHCGNFHIIIDISQDGNYRYRCWNNNRPVSDTPDLQISGGSKLFWDESGEVMTCEEDNESSPKGYIYSFSNKNYRYEYHTGRCRGKEVDELLIYRNGNELIYRQQCN